MTHQLIDLRLNLENHRTEDENIRNSRVFRKLPNSFFCCLLLLKIIIAIGVTILNKMINHFVYEIIYVLLIAMSRVPSVLILGFLARSCVVIFYIHFVQNMFVFLKLQIK